MGGKELGFSRPSAASLKEQLARKTLRNVRSQGHTYVDLREDGKRFIFFCTICLAPCYSDAVLFEHLGGHLHKERLSAAKATLIGRNPWPFDDGVLFFRNSDEEDGVDSRGSGKVRLLAEGELVDDLAIVVGSGDLGEGHNGRGNGGGVSVGDGSSRDRCEGAFDLVVPGVVGKDEVSDLGVKMMGYGEIAARIVEKDGVNAVMWRLWCEWLGKKDGDKDEIHSRIPSDDFGILTFSYYYDLGKQGLFDEIKTLLLTRGEDSDNVCSSLKRRKLSVSDSEGGSERLSHQGYSSGEDSQGSASTTSSALLLHRYDDQLLQSRIISNKSLRRELRRQKRAASEKMCDICQHKMLPGKDVATLLNLKTGRLACSSRNLHGAFHIFHTSCLVHWILLCEYEMFMRPPPEQPKTRRRSRKKVKPKFSQLVKESEEVVSGVKQSQTRKESEEGALRNQICSVFCPDCQGSGVEIEGGELEKPSISLKEMFKYKIKVNDAHRAWMKSPEALENCSTGFAFPVQAEDSQEQLVHMKLLHFYRADEDSCP